MKLTPIMSCYKTFFFSFSLFQNKLGVCLIFASQTKTYWILAPFRVGTLPSNIKQGCKGLQRTNTLAHLSKKKSFYHRRKDDREKTDKKKFDSFVDRLSSCEKSVKELSNKSLNDVEQKLKSFSKVNEENSAQVFCIKRFSRFKTKLFNSFTHLLIHSFAHSPIHSLSHSSIRPLSLSSIHSPSHLLICSFAHLLICSFAHLLICSFAHSSIHS